MSNILQRAIAAIAASKQALGNRPATEVEWDKLFKAYEGMLTLMLRVCGLSQMQARSIAKSIFGGDAGRMLQNIAKHGASND